VVEVVDCGPENPVVEETYLERDHLINDYHLAGQWNDGTSDDVISTTTTTITRNYEWTCRPHKPYYEHSNTNTIIKTINAQSQTSNLHPSPSHFKS
jgi:hypothetical protein